MKKKIEKGITFQDFIDGFNDIDDSQDEIVTDRNGIVSIQRKRSK